MESFGTRLKRRRQERDLSQVDLADLMGKSGKSVISSWETSKAEPSLSDLRKLAEVLETTPAWLIDGIEEGKSLPLRVAPPGFVLVLAEEFIDLQRRVIQRQDEQK